MPTCRSCDDEVDGAVGEAVECSGGQHLEGAGEAPPLGARQLVAALRVGGAGELAVVLLVDLVGGAGRGQRHVEAIEVAVVAGLDLVPDMVLQAYQGAELGIGGSNRAGEVVAGADDLAPPIDVDDYLADAPWSTPDLAMLGSD